MNPEYITTVGLEIHAELSTKTKMFCKCLNESAAGDIKPNVNVCPICMGHPGTLPVVNKEAVKSVLKVGVALQSNLADFTEFDRKNYFYPDIPKGYQISQYKYPLVAGGSLNGIEITRIHLEEDTARSSHESGDAKDGYSLVDFNRAGVPLMELVTEPVIHDAKTASDFAKALQLLLQTLDVAHAEMSKGEMRVEANISVSKKEGEFGTKVEVKNLNSFRAVERAIEYEVKRHIELLEKGEKIIQETRGWDENKQATFSQRQKEDSHDYRYFPDPDLPKLKLSLISEFSKENLQKELPELPWIKRERYSKAFGLSDQYADFFAGDIKMASYFDEIAAKLSNNEEVQLAANYITADLVGLSLKKTFKAYPSSEDMAELVRMIKKSEISSRGAKDILKLMTEEAGNPRDIAEKNNLFQKSDTGEIETMLSIIIEAHPSVVADYKAGKEAALMFFVGQVMKQSKGSANPGVAKEIALKLLQKDI